MAQARRRDEPAQEVSSLDEPVEVTIVTLTQMRDLRKLAFKLKYVILPQAGDSQKRELRDWDLWGPLFICIFLAFALSLASGSSVTEETGSMAFALVFSIVWIGAAIVTLNAQLLGTPMYFPPSSFFQSVCVLGYSLFPLAVSAVFGLLLGSNIILVRLMCVAVGSAWSIKSATGFIEHITPAGRWQLAAYPVILFYVFLGWFVMIV